MTYDYFTWVMCTIYYGRIFDIVYVYISISPIIAKKITYIHFRNVFFSIEILVPAIVYDCNATN